ncbi:MAG TPA: UDP-N-acetylmuramate--L-alanine ligase [Gemmatimonadales bacterium]|nr:UDP-N-acetylmuramate--L-alanine ligase [Gemmatimonadales bacterium]
MALFDPDDPRPLHFVGIGGAGMSALALLARRRGVRVTGCDPDPSGADDVAAAGAEVWPGHDPSHVEGARGVVVTAAVAPGHPELERARNLGLPVVPRKEALAAFVAGGRTIAVAGTHGKTTTTAMTTEALAGAGLAPTGIAGGRVSHWGGNARPGRDALFVVEADEYDRAFLALHPSVAVITNVEADHLEIYGTLEAIEEAFVEFAGRAGRVIACADDAGAERVAGRLGVPVWRYGTTAGADLAIGSVRQGPDGSRAEFRLPDGTAAELRLRVPGLHNVRNAAAALAAALAVGADRDRALAALAAFPGVGRRFERLGDVGGVSVVDDYAHHPTELVATLAAARQAYPGRRLVAVFQPHLFSRTQAHGDAMGQALAAADLVIVTEIYAARERPVSGVSGRLVADAASAAGAEVRFVPLRADLTREVADVLRPGDVVLTLGAGDITRAGHELVAWLAA